MNRGAAFYRNVARLALPILLQNLCTTHHEGVDEAQKGGGQILQQNGQAQQYHVSVKAAAAFQVRKQTVTSLRSWF